MSNKPLLIKEYHALKSEDFEIKNVNGKNRVYLTGILQRADTINGNGRIYEKKILDREVSKYGQFIKEKRSVGELDHCIKEGAKILTIDGWKDFRDISENEKIVTLNTKTNTLENQQIIRKIVKEFDGELLQFSHLNIQTSVTPEHRFYLIDRYGKSEFVTAQEIFENRTKFSKHRIPRTAENVYYDDKELFILPAIANISTKCSNSLKEKYSQSLEIPMDVWSSFLGLFLAEGCSAKTDPNYCVWIYQKLGNKCDQIESLLNKMPFNWKKRIVANGTQVVFSTVDMRLNAYLRPLGHSWEKYIPQDMKNLAPIYLQNIIEWFMLGDGRVRKNSKWKSKEIFSTSLKLIEDLAEILLKSGGCGNIHTEKRIGNKTKIRDHFATAKYDMHFLHLSTTNSIYLDRRFVKIEPEKYVGNVYCVQVPNQTFFCLDNGKIYLSGNCNTTEVNLKNVSHIVEQTWWENNDLKGKIRLLNTTSGKEAQALIDDDVTLGISTRGLGSVTEKNGVVHVNEDYHLVCWDLVHDPSTTGAFMLKEGKYIRVEYANGQLIEIPDEKEIVVIDNKINKKLQSIVDSILKNKR